MRVISSSVMASSRARASLLIFGGLFGSRVSRRINPGPLYVGSTGRDDPNGAFSLRVHHREELAIDGSDCLAAELPVCRV